MAIILTNKYNKPQAIVDAIKNDLYDGYDSDYTATSLSSPILLRWLQKNRDSVVDVMDMLHLLLGEAVHMILEKANGKGYVKEKRVYWTYNNLKISGKFDVYYHTTKLLQDYKTAKAYSLVYKDTLDKWKTQMNYLRFLMHHNNIPVEKAEMVAILKDFEPKRAGLNHYPPDMLPIIPIPLDDLAVTEANIIADIERHEQWKNAKVTDIPICTHEERWYQPEKWLVRLGNNKVYNRATHALAKRDCDRVPNSTMELVPESFRRCEQFCSVKHVCPVYVK